MAYLKEHKPFLKLFAPCLKALGYDFFPHVELPVEEEDSESSSESEEEEDEDFESDEEEERVRVDKHMRKHLNNSVLAGSKYFWNYHPEKR